MKKTFVSLCAFSIILSAAGITHAHGSGVTLDQVFGDYTVSVDYNAVAGIFAGDPVQFAFELFTKDRSRQLDFADVWITIVPTGGSAIYTPPAFDGGIVGSSFPPSGMTFIFPHGGSYDLKLRYEKDGKTLAEATFPLKVENSDKSVSVDSSGFHFSRDFLKGGVTVLIVVLGIEFAAWMLPKRKKE